MKRIYASKAINSGVLFCITLLLTSCSSLWLHRDQTVDSVNEGGVQSGAGVATSVPKEQYDELARKYQELLNQSKNLPTAETPKAMVATDPSISEQAKPQVATSTNIDPSELVNRIDNAIPDAVPVDGIEPIKKEIGPAVPNSMGVKTVNNTDDLDEQIARLREVHELVKVNKFEAALIILKELESSPEKQIVVRAKMMLGDLLFNQGEYDLSSQVYEEIINKYAFSGFVIKALGKLVVCSEKLKQPEKQAKYYSLLHDFFEAS
ncbi:MAG: tetratricopeptide repeat protein [Bdellovibrionales bacterium]|nr:tetratricopeptide repeat protein [Bdellovibrionales bacterium]